MKKKLSIVKAIEEQHVQQLLALFPKGDSEYFKACLEHYNENAVERIAEKILVDMGGQYPQLPIASEPHDNRLNASLRILALDLFPSCDISYLRELVLNFSYAHIEQVVEVLTSTSKWPERLDFGKMDPSQGIRSEKYKKQAQAQLILDYPQVWKSSIRAVLAENNWDYLKCFEQLKEMGSGGFWKTLRNFFSHWSVSSSSLNTGQAVTDYHLLQQLKELRQYDIDKQIAADRDYAYRMNTTEYTHHQQLMTCLCCYSDYAFEELAFCSEGDHAFCHGCLIHYISEGLFGQGELRGVPSISCISSNDECKGVFPTTTLKRILSNDIWMAYENSLLEGGINEHDRIQCCACPYFEVDESTKPLNSTLIYASKFIRSLTKWIMVVDAIVLYYNWIVLILILLPLHYIFITQWDMKADLEIAYQRVSKSRRSNVFTCKNEECKTLTCLECHRPVRGLHTCWEKETDGLRLYVEKAMADAVKRTCPNCSLSFQKSDGCNKIVCRCGYAMCYICRKDIGEESYNHFCQHFRARPGSNCSSCKKCDLYKTAPDDEAVQLAATRAKNQYLQAHPDIHTNHLVIGPKRTLDRLVELRQELVIKCLEKGLQYLV